MTVQIIRDWVLRFNAEGPSGLIDRDRPGPRRKLDGEALRALIRKVEDGPIPAADGVVRWRLKDLAAWLIREFGVSVDETTIGRALKAAGYAKLSARPHHHARDEAAMQAFKKTSPTR